MRHISQEIHDAITTDGTFLGFTAGKVWSVVGGINEFGRRIMGSNLIQRNPATIVQNLLWDKYVAGRFFAGSGYTNSAIGRQAQRDAYRMLLGLDMKDSVPTRLRSSDIFPDFDVNDPVVREVVEAGGMGDTFMGSPLVGNLREKYINIVYGPSKDTTIERVARKMLGRGQEGKSLGQRVAISLEDNPRLKKVDANIGRLERRIDGLISTKSKNVKLLTGLQDELEALKMVRTRERKGVNVRKSVDYLRWAVGLDNRIGSFAERRTISNALYQRLGNVHRVGGYLYLRRMGVPKSVARERLRKFMQDYSNLPAMVKFARNSPFANPIFSFPFEYLRIAGNQIAEHPALFAGMTAAPAAIGAVSAAANGYDPVQLWQFMSRDSWMDGVVEAATTLYLPSHSGGLYAVGSSQLGGLQMLRRPFGPVGQAVDELEKNPTAANIAASAGLRIFGGFFGQNMFVDAVSRMMFGSDPITDREISPGFPRVASAVESTSRNFVPGWMPFFSRNAEIMLDSLKRGPEANTERVVAAHEQVLQRLAGFHVRGGLLEDYAKLIGVEGGLDFGTKLFVNMAGAGKRLEKLVTGPIETKVLGASDPALPTPQVLPESHSRDQESLMLSLMYASAKFDPSNINSQGSLLDNSYKDQLREAHFWEQHGKETNDQPLVTWARKRRKAVRERMLTYYENQQAFYGRDPKEIETFTDGEMEKLLVKVQQGVDYNEYWQNMGIIRQTHSLIAASAIGVREDIILPLAMGTILNLPQGTLKGYQSVRAVRLAHDSLTKYLQSHSVRARALPQLQQLHSWLTAELSRLDVQDQVDRAVDPLRTAAFETLQESK
jgi:hypothetical protein